MTAAVQNLVIEQKATFKKRLTCRDKFRKAINLTGFTAHMQIRDQAGSIIADMTTENGKITLGGVAGTIDLTIPVSDTSTFTFTSATYDLKLINPDTTHDRIMQGKVTLSVGVTA